MCPGRVGEGLGGGGGEGDFSPAAAAFQRDSARPRGREAGTAERGRSLCLASPGPISKKPKQRVRKCRELPGPLSPHKDTPLSSPECRAGWRPLGASGCTREVGVLGCQVKRAGKCQRGVCSPRAQVLRNSGAHRLPPAAGPSSGSPSKAGSGVRTVLEYYGVWSTGRASLKGLSLPGRPGFVVREAP